MAVTQSWSFDDAVRDGSSFISSCSRKKNKTKQKFKFQVLTCRQNTTRKLATMWNVIDLLILKNRLSFFSFSPLCLDINCKYVKCVKTLIEKSDFCPTMSYILIRCDSHPRRVIISCGLCYYRCFWFPFVRRPEWKQNLTLLGPGEDNERNYFKMFCRKIDSDPITIASLFKVYRLDYSVFCRPLSCVFFYNLLTYLEFVCFSIGISCWKSRVGGTLGISGWGCAAGTLDP